MIKRGWLTVLVIFWTSLLVGQERAARPQQDAPAAATSRVSLLVGAQGSAALEAGKSRAEVEALALAEAKRLGLAKARAHLASATGGTSEGEGGIDLELLGEPSSLWSGDTCQVRIRGEVRLQPRVLEALTKHKPLEVRLWTSRPTYRQGEHIQVFLLGSKPFQARLLYQDAEGKTLQLLPNPYRKAHAYPGGATVAVPAGEDRFQITVAPPFGAERLVLFASTAPLGDLAVENLGAVFGSRALPVEASRHSRSVKVEEKGEPWVVEYFEGWLDLKTMP